MEVVIVVENIVVFQADVGINGILNCDVSSISIGGSNISQDGLLVYIWILNGVLIVSVDSLIFEANQFGLYQFFVFNIDNQCEVLDEVEVFIDIILLIVIVLVFDVLICIIISL